MTRISADADLIVDVMHSCNAWTPREPRRYCLVGPQRVIVTGAGGQTGQALFRKMLDLPDEFMPLGLSAPRKQRSFGSSGVPEDNVAVVDVSGSSSGRPFKRPFNPFVPTRTSRCFLHCHIRQACTHWTRRGWKTHFWIPQRCSRTSRLDRSTKSDDACPPGTAIVVCSSMGGTDPSNRLNAFGRETLEDGSHKGGKILLWKRKAEVYLMDKCKNNGDYSYTIVHPGGLVNEPGGEREIVVGWMRTNWTESRSIPVTMLLL
ncbi:Complex I intermediate-associated protein 30 domain containing protein [Seminavis robusta]|uniref:Complex I intermediate-associated protein 30 domain containing protein n=1 Tax=Seminavis robusta TaxID=568900 RepID=A0A9N8DKS3_9STRA|nr:Complex I intermediate-associated protein 30 domain containing protein [Seminavis robusta]|eukprot:Sro198_g084230.1 Complex I intermediate-associated protein 30 domain containing protein (261) ;mRNA; f:89143-90032